MSFLDELNKKVVSGGSDWESKFVASIEEQRSLIEAGELSAKKLWWKKGKANPKVAGRTFLAGPVSCGSKKDFLAILDGLSNFEKDSKLKAVLEAKASEVTKGMTVARAKIGK